MNLSAFQKHFSYFLRNFEFFPQAIENDKDMSYTVCHPEVLFGIFWKTPNASRKQKGAPL